MPLVAGPLEKHSGLETVVRAYRGVDFVRGLPDIGGGVYRIDAQQTLEIFAVRDHLTQAINAIRRAARPSWIKRAIAAIHRAAGWPDQPKS